jgi:hypothetical protein
VDGEGAGGVSISEREVLARPVFKKSSGCESVSATALPSAATPAAALVVVVVVVVVVDRRVLPKHSKRDIPTRHDLY